MQKDEIKAKLAREPFIPFRIHLSDGRKFDVPFRDVAHLIPSGILVFIGLKQGTHQAKGYDRFGYEHITRVEHRPSRGADDRRKKPSSPDTSLAKGMTKDEVAEKLAQEPFVPLELRTIDGLRIRIPFHHVAVLTPGGLMVFRGVKHEGSRVATGRDFVAFDKIISLGPRRSRGGRRKKAS